MRIQTLRLNNHNGVEGYAIRIDGTTEFMYYNDTNRQERYTLGDGEYWDTATTGEIVSANLVKAIRKGFARGNPDRVKVVTHDTHSVDRFLEWANR